MTIARSCSSLTAWVADTEPRGSSSSYCIEEEGLEEEGTDLAGQRPFVQLLLTTVACFLQLWDPP